MAYNKHANPCFDEPALFRNFRASKNNELFCFFKPRVSRDIRVIFLKLILYITQNFRFAEIAKNPKTRKKRQKCKNPTKFETRVKKPNFQQKPNQKYQ
jgi:hypothetical protein